MEELRKEEEAEKQARLGPGGLDPAEVFESLPKVTFLLTILLLWEFVER